MTNVEGYTWYSGTLRDGKITTQLFTATGYQWQDVMDDAGPLSLVLPLANPAAAALNPYLTAEPCRCFQAIAYTDPEGTETFLAGGPVWTHSYDSATRRLTINGAGIWSYYDHRKVLPVLAAGVSPAGADTTYDNLTLGTIAKRLVQLAHTHTGGALPIVLPDDETGDQSRTYKGADMAAVGQMLRDLTAVDGGPEISFVPRRRSDDPRYLEWVMRVGTAAQPLLTQSGDDRIFDTTVRRSGITAVNVNRDGTAMGTRAWSQGSGTGAGTLFGRADDTALIDGGFPLLEVTESGHESDNDQSVLDGWATGLLQRSQRPVETWTLTVRRDRTPTVGSYAVGDWVSITIGDDEPYLPSGTHRARIVSKSGDDTPNVKVELMPTLGGV